MKPEKKKDLLDLLKKAEANIKESEDRLEQIKKKPRPS